MFQRADPHRLAIDKLGTIWASRPGSTPGQMHGRCDVEKRNESPSRFIDNECMHSMGLAREGGGEPIFDARRVLSSRLISGTSKDT